MEWTKSPCPIESNLNWTVVSTEIYIGFFGWKEVDKTDGCFDRVCLPFSLSLLSLSLSLFNCNCIVIMLTSEKNLGDKKKYFFPLRPLCSRQIKIPPHHITWYSCSI
jgi:hypothetical protein